MRVPYPMITGDLLDRRLDQGVPLLLADLGSREEYESGHLRGAVNVPFEELFGAAGEGRAGAELSDGLRELPGALRSLPPGAPLVFYCGRGAKSMRACGRLCRLGWPVADLAGGLLYYRGKYL